MTDKTTRVAARELAKLPAEARVRMLGAIIIERDKWKRIEATAHADNGSLAISPSPTFAYVLGMTGDTGLVVQSFEEATIEFCKRGFTAKGSRFYAANPILGSIRDASGKVVAHVSPNGKVWEGSAREWTTKTQMLAASAESLVWAGSWVRS